MHWSATLLNRLGRSAAAMDACRMVGKDRRKQPYYHDPLFSRVFFAIGFYEPEGPPAASIADVRCSSLS
jgi:hypothetical protein